MKLDPIMEEYFSAKYALGEKYSDVRSLVSAIHLFSVEHPLRPAPAHRKMLADHPVGRSVFRDDPILAELRAIKEQMSLEMGTAKPIRRLPKTAPKKATAALRRFKESKARDAR